MKQKLIRYSLILLVSLFIVTGLILLYLFHWPFFQPAETERTDIIINRGDTFSVVSTRLLEQGVIRNRENLLLIARLTGATTKIKAGKFTLPLHSSNYRVLTTLTRGAENFIKVTIPEGTTSWKIASILQARLSIDSVKFISLVHDPACLEKYKIYAHSLEGYLYPETYYLTFGMSEEQVIDQFVHQFFQNVTDSLIRAGEQYNFSLNQIVTLASIIEGEAILDSEMVYISSVYHNRLRTGMLLQADPTIQYVLADKPRRLLNRDLEIESPYNTYKYTGLPPGAIGSPGINAIRAAVYPADSDYFYFVADGKGGHIFSETLRQHVNAKHQFNKIRRQVAREKRLKGQAQQ